MKQATCHPDKKLYAKGLCRTCYEQNLRIKNPNYWEKQKENCRKWHKKNKQKKADYDKQYRKQNPADRYKKYISSIKREYGISEEDYIKLLEKCNGKCTICGRPPYKGKRLHLDHNHETKEIRGLLCTRCNWYLHTIEKNPNILNIIKEYLKYA